MAGQTVTISVLADTKKFSSAFKKLGNETGLTKLASGAKKVGKALLIAGAAAAAAALVIGKKLLDAGEKASTSNARVEQIATTMGLFGDQASNVSKRLTDLANKTAVATGVDQNSIKAAQAKLLTFKELAGSADTVGGAFDRTTDAALDLAAAGFGTAEGNAEKLGRAMDNPVKNLNTLRRSGIEFTEVEKKRIETLVNSNKVGEAQAIILGKIESKVGGTAEATADASDKMKVKWSQLQENLGLKLMPILDKVSGFFIDKIVPAIEKGAEAMAKKLQPALKTVVDWFKKNQERIKEVATALRDQLQRVLKTLVTWLTNMAQGLKTMGEWMVKNQDWLIPLAAAIAAMVLAYQAYVKVMAIWKAGVAAASAAQVILNAVMAANPIGLIVLAIVGLVAAIVVLWKKNEGFRDLVKGVWEGIQKVFSSSVEAIKKFLKSAWDFIKKVWSYSPLGLITGNWKKVLAFFKEIPKKIKAYFTTAISWLKSFGQNIIKGLLNGVKAYWVTLANWYGNLGSKIKGFFSNALNWLTASGRNIIRGVLNGVKKGWTNMGTWLRNLPNVIKGYFKYAGTWLLQTGKNVISGFINGIKNMFGSVKGALGDLTSKLTSWKGPPERDKKLLVGAGKSIIGGLRTGLQSEFGNVKKDLTNLTRDIGKTDVGTVKMRGGVSLDLEAAAGRGGARVAPVYNLTVQALASSPEVGRQVVRAIKDFERMGGTR